jgi:hypothetical protein
MASTTSCEGTRGSVGNTATEAFDACLHAATTTCEVAFSVKGCLQLMRPGCTSISVATA